MAVLPRFGVKGWRVLVQGILLAGLGLGGLMVRAADADGDGMADEIEAALGSTPDVAEAFVPILARTVPEKVADRARAIAGIAMANAGQNRFVWRLEFAADYPKANSNVVLYLDADNNPKTGRKDHGCEVMFIVTEGAGSVSAFKPDGSSTVAPAPRAAIAGKYLYIAYDVDLPQQDGQSLVRLMLLSETWNPHKGVDNTGYFSAKGPGLGTRAKAKLDSDLTESIGMLRTYGPRTIDPIVSATENVRLPVFGCTLEGFRFQPSEYRADNVTRVALPARIVGTAPTAGSFYPGFVIHDAGGREVLAVYVNDRRQGVAVADWDDNNQHLFFTAAPVAIRQGDRIEVRALSAEGVCRIEDLVLLRNRPEPRAAVCAIRNLQATENRLTWITTWPVTCTVQFGDGQSLAETGRWNNHRVTIPGLKPGQSVRYQVTATGRDGKEVASGWHDYAWAAPAEPPTPAAGAVTLQVTPPDGAALADWPVTGGVPFPKGVLGTASHLRLLDGAGKELPLQASVTARWQDGSVKWTLVDFRHSGPAATYQLRYAPAPAAAPSAAAPAGEPSPACGTLHLTNAAGVEFSADLRPATVEETGALRTAHAGTGAITAPDGKSCFAYEVRAHRYPGTPWTRVLLSIGNDAAEAEFTTVESLRWDLPAAAPAPAFVRQHTDDHYSASGGDGKRWTGPVGSVRVRDVWQNYPLDIEAGPAGTGLWLFPKLRLDEYAWAKDTVDEHRLFYWFDPLPARNAGGYKLRQGMTKTYEVWLGADGAIPPHDRPLMPVCPPAWYAKSMVFGEFGAADPDREVVRDYDAKVNEAFGAYLKDREDSREYGQFNFGDWWGERVINWGNIEYDTQHAFFLQFARSGDLRFLQAGEEAERHNRDIDTVQYHQDPLRLGRVYSHCIGHVGDYLAKSPLEGPNRGSPHGGFSPSHTWCEGHTDHYFLTGDRRSQATARKIADNYASYGTVNYDFHNCREPGWDLIFTMAVYRGTGDPFYLNAAQIIVERVLERQTEEPALGSAGGGWRRRLVPGHCLCEPAHYGNAGFMVGVLLTGLKWYHLETQDERVARAIHLGSRFLVADMWVPEVQGFRYTTCPKSSAGPWANLLLFDGMGYAYRLSGDKDLARILAQGTDAAIQSLSGWGKSYTMYIRVAPHVLGLLAELRESPPLPLPRLMADVPTPLSGRTAVAFDASGTRLPKGTVASCTWDFGDGSTGTGVKVEHSYAAGQYRAVLSVKAGDQTETAATAISVPPPEVLTASPDRAVLVEAESFSAQGGGKVKVATGRKGASGAIVTSWQDALGHWLEWKAKVPVAGKYRLLLKYCSDSPAPRRELLVDGASPAEACKEIRFERTGGFSTGTDDWRYLAVSTAGQPLRLDLSAGEHVLRMANLGDGLALDWLLLLPAE